MRKIRLLALLTLAVWLLPSRSLLAVTLPELLAQWWEEQQQAFPEKLALSGAPLTTAAWTDYSSAALAKQDAFAHATWISLQTIPRSSLAPAAQLDYDLLAYELRRAVELSAFAPGYRMLNAFEGVALTFDVPLALMPRRSARDYYAILERLRALPVPLQQLRALLRDSLLSGLLPSAITVDSWIDRLRELAGNESHRSSLLWAFTQFPPSLALSERKRIEARASEMFAQEVHPALTDFVSFLEEEVRPKCAGTLGLSQLPRGKEWYVSLLRFRTKEGMTPEALHELGKSEVARLRERLRALLREVGFPGTEASFSRWMLTAPQFFFPDEAALLAAYHRLLRRVTPQLPLYFSLLPARPLQFRSGAWKGMAAASYSNGMFSINTAELAKRPRWQVPALFLHEGLPGHHLQIALAQELPHLAPFRRYNASHTAFKEGWALYAESLGTALGAYETPFDRYGQLEAELWRSIRLVADTGLNYFGWSAAQVRDYFAANAGVPAPDVEADLLRYASLPAQALAYKVGELEIHALKANAKAKLGPRFSEGAFHQVLLSEGALPLALLPSRVKALLGKGRTEGKKETTSSRESQNPSSFRIGAETVKTSNGFAR